MDGVDKCTAFIQELKALFAKHAVKVEIDCPKQSNPLFAVLLRNYDTDHGFIFDMQDIKELTDDPQPTP